MANDDNAPATKGDLKQFKEEIISEMTGKMNGMIEKNNDKIFRYFDVVAENMRHDLVGAHRDQVEVLKDKSKNHEERIKALERSKGFSLAA